MISAGPVITKKDVGRAQEIVEVARLQLFRVRLDRTTDLERADLRAMAELGSGPQLAGDVAALLNRTSQQVGPTRDA